MNLTVGTRTSTLNWRSSSGKIDERTFPSIVSSSLFDFATTLRVRTVELLKDRAFSSRIGNAGKHVSLRTIWIAFRTNRRVQRPSKSSSDSPPVHASGQRRNDSRQRWKNCDSRSVTKQNNDALFLVPARFLSIQIGPLESVSRASPLKSYRFQLCHFSSFPYLKLVNSDRWKSKFPRRFRSKNVVFSRSHVEDTRRPDRLLAQEIRWTMKSRFRLHSRFHLDRSVLSAKKFRWLVIRRRENDLDLVGRSASKCKRSKSE